ncbi:MFS transporter [Pseudomonas vancouverensis]|uniref:MFS transporter n=1 Tax=Pseudomonas vancouverensis TaxID=95300 RepID=A0A1H2NSQ3_PSEVA|nr:MFS transporter [Pseudomonas vancouverensis]KAB0491107.1 MFS transporter [Pseudomonas vancouverensis]TDB59681.1 MFS transporter [Pseudomonas vancouverensis]SDV08453.1 Major Facilitator Superfamily protein [Pseudomonas vancouverensis]
MKSQSISGALLSLSLSMLLSSLGTSIANVGLPTLADAFSASFQAVQWVVLAYLLAVTALIVSVGRFGDLLGRRRLLLMGIALFSGASVLCGLAPSLDWLIAARVLQGAGAAIMMALSMALVGEAVAKDRMGSAMGLLGTMSAIGTSLGPTLGGWLIAHTGCQGLFLVNGPLGVLALLLSYRFLPGDRGERRAGWASFDVRGTLLLVSTLLAYALAMTLGRGHFGALDAALLLAAVFGLGLFVVVERSVDSPLIQLSVFSHPRLSGGFAMSALVTTVVMASMVVGPFYLGGALGLPMASVGLVMSAGPLVAALVGIPAGRWVDRFGAERSSNLGLMVMLIGSGSGSLCLLPMQLGVIGYLASLSAMTAGYALFQAANNTAVMSGIEAQQRGVIAGLLGLSRNLGLITGASAMGAVFAFGSAAGDVLQAQPQALAQGMRLTFAVAAGLIVIALIIDRISRNVSRRSLASY